MIDVHQNVSPVPELPFLPAPPHIGGGGGGGRKGSSGTGLPERRFFLGCVS